MNKLSTVQLAIDCLCALLDVLLKLYDNNDLHRFINLLRDELLPYLEDLKSK